MTKHTPATPLPFDYMPDDVGTYGVFAFDDDTGHIEVSGRATEKDAAYITHAANAYPKLVEALQQLLAPETLKAVCIRDSRALLRELGEDE